MDTANLGLGLLSLDQFPIYQVGFPFFPPLFCLEIFSSGLEKAKFIGMTILCRRGLLPRFIFCSSNSLMLSFLQWNSLLRWSGTRLKGNTSHKDIKPVVSSRTFIYFLCQKEIFPWAQGYHSRETNYFSNSCGAVSDISNSVMQENMLSLSGP